MKMTELNEVDEKNDETTNAAEPEDKKKETLEVDFEALAKIPPMEIFRAMAKERGIPLRDPKRNCPQCHGTGCRGRKPGTHEPIPCNCIIPARDENGGAALYSCNANRAERRSLAKKRR
jgi:hypothetical protein